jgi:hypothetical protein
LTTLILTYKKTVMNKVRFAAVTATMFVAVIPALAGLAYEAEQDYEGWPSAHKTMTDQLSNGYVNFRANQTGW